jgi:hypothetical protein
MWKVAGLELKNALIQIESGYIYGQKFNYQDATPTNNVRTGLRIDTGIVRCTFNQTYRLQTTVTFNTTFGSIPIVQLTKTETSNGLTNAEHRNGVPMVLIAGASTFTARYYYNGGTFASGDYMDLHWLAIGEW